MLNNDEHKRDKAINKNAEHPNGFSAYNSSFIKLIIT
ncbi:hypothetical protein GGQ92_000953 [Gracilibacillus halotolerans]|uniref:Uncharacterized protein n=1 Tax=Gracilibacillus halotolerans TaxID=74386 RepID=A0A841RJM4_9BACI|nr:hypothetical protein [Gracilibacillus halotolerans]